MYCMVGSDSDSRLYDRLDGLVRKRRKRVVVEGEVFEIFPEGVHQSQYGVSLQVFFRQVFLSVIGLNRGVYSEVRMTRVL